ncbi:ead/Ea22-like family protein [Salmonella enterica]
MTALDKQALREEFRLMQAHYSDPADRARQVIYIAAEALLDELETKEEQRANWFQMAQKLGEDLDAAEKRNAEQREYYEGVIADGSKRIAELESNPIATLDVQSGRADGNKFALVYSSAAHKLPDDVYHLCVAAAGIAKGA